MKKILMVLPAAALFACCSTSKLGKSTAALSNTSATNRTNLPYISDAAGTSPSDAIVATGFEYIPVEGKSETGTRADLEGSWELDSLNGAAVPGKSGINPELTDKKMTDVGDRRHDSTTTSQIINGVTHTTTTVLVDKTGTSPNKITPPQGPNYHIPSKPVISFYGSNETFSGFTGCNRFSGRYMISGRDTISLKSSAASTKMVCIGDYDEDIFLQTLRRANSFKAVNGRLELREGTNVILVFVKKQL